MFRMASLCVVAVLGSVSARSVGSASDVLITDFDPVDKQHSLSWTTVNDGVMGGVSSSSFQLDAINRVGVWKGTVRIVPFLHAAGFCTVRGSSQENSIPDLSSTDGLVIDVTTVSSETNLSTFQAQFESSVRTTERGGGFIANFMLDKNSAQVRIPFSSFVESWRGQKVGGAPSKKQLANIVQIGVGADGTPGTFELHLKQISAYSGAPPGPTPSPPCEGAIQLVGFDGGERSYEWHVINDPVMGGLSRSTFVVKDGVGIFDGEVRIVPSLKAPGFCNAEAIPSFPHQMQNAASTLGGGIRLRVQNSGNLTAFKVAFGTRMEYNFGSYKADVNIPNSPAPIDIVIPYQHFSNKWSASTGEPTVKCSDDARVCPTAKALEQIGSVGIWGEGVAGAFHLEFSDISAIPGSC